MERWRDAEWGEWEQLRDRLHDLGIEAIGPTHDRGGLYAEGREAVHFSELFRHHDEKPVLAALRRLEERVAKHVGGLGRRLGTEGAT